MAANSYITVSTLASYHKGLLAQLDETYYTKAKTDELIAKINAGTIEEWRGNVEYEKGAMVVHECVIYRALVKHTSATFDSTKWEVIGGGEEEKEDIDYSKWVSAPSI